MTERRGPSTRAAALGAVLVIVVLAGLAWRGARSKPDPEVDAARLLEARENLEGGDAEGAVRMLEDMLRSAQSSEAHYLLGNAYADLHRYDDAAQAYRRALGLQDQHIDARANLAVALYHLERHEEARAELEYVLGQRPQDADLHYNLGGILLALGDLERAEEEFLKARELDPDLEEALLGLGTLYHLQGRYEASVEALRTYVGLSGDPLWQAEAERLLAEGEHALQEVAR